MGLFALMYFGLFFGYFLPYCCLVAVGMGNVSAAFNAPTSVFFKMIVPYGPDMMYLFDTFTMTIVFGHRMPKDKWQ